MSDFANDISYDLAYSAHSGTSHVPDRRAESERTSYAEHLQSTLDRWHAMAETDEQREIVAAEFERYRDGYRRRVSAWLSAKSRIVSVMIAGGSNFPVRQMEKRNATEHRRLTELLDWDKRARAAAEKRISPAARDSLPIMAGDADAAERLRAKIADAEALQAQMKAVNAAHKKFLKDAASLDKSDLPESIKAKVRNYKPAYSWEPHPIAPYELTNNNANIRRLKARLVEVERNKQAEAVEIEGDGVRLEDSPADNRIRLFFDGKPEADVRADLKRHGFRWTPSLGCWQAYRNWRSIEAAKRLAGLQAVA